MDLNFTPDEQAFRAEIRQWVADNLPQDISYKVHNALRLTKDDLATINAVLPAGSARGDRYPKAGMAGINQ